MLAAAARTASPAALARSARCFATDWSAVTAKTTSDITKGEVNRLRQTHGEGAALAAKFASPPAPIDWAAYKGKIRSAGVVESFEKSYVVVVVVLLLLLALRLLPTSTFTSLRCDYYF